MKDLFWILRWKQHKLGFERSTITVQGEKYLTRWILHFGLFCLRLHKFYRGDDDRALHDHPFWFVTYPLKGYWEETELYGFRWVKPHRLHFRGRDFKHRVVGPAAVAIGYLPGPFYTLVLAGPYSDTWGFYTEAGEYVPWQEWE